MFILIIIYFYDYIFKQMKFISFLKVYFVLFFLQINNKEAVIKENKDLEQKPLKKRKMIDIDTLREECVDILVELLSLIENKLQKYFIKDKDKTKKILDIFQWVNQTIQIFIHDPSQFGRSEIQNCLHNANAHKIFLNSI